jgi:hypothetical protein
VFHNYGDVFLRSRDTTQVLGFELGQQGRQVGARERPLKGFWCLFVAGLKGEQSVFEFAQRREVIRRDDLAVDDREVDFNLVEPTRVLRSMDEGHGGPLKA